MLDKEQFYALDEPTNKDYLFSELEFITNETDENWTKWVSTKRPQTTKVWNQGSTPACVGFASTHINNGQNILEDESVWDSRPQRNPLDVWNRFCADRNNYSTWTSIQTMANWFKKQWFIQWFVSIKNSEEDIVNKIKKALDLNMFILTGSSNWDWSEIKKTGIYTKRTDTLYVWHGWGIVDYWQDYFLCINSYWDKRWPLGWYFKLPFSMVKDVYSKIAFIDMKDNNFWKLKLYKKAQEMITLGKEVYAMGDDNVKKYFEKIELSKNINNLIKI